MREEGDVEVSDPIVPLRDALADTCGPKAASLASLLAVGLPVPDGFVVPARLYREHVRRSGLLPLASAASEGRTAAVAELRERIASAPLDALLLDALAAAHRVLGSPPVAVRSSATAEDLPGHSFAGQHGTYFCIGFGELAGRVTDCWASLWSDRAFEYRERNGLDHLAADMAVIVQALVPAEAAGVAFTVDPVTGERRVVVEACLGIGESLVSGRVAPDRYVLSRPALDVVERSIGAKDVELATDPNGHVEQRDVEPGRAAMPAIAEAQAIGIARLALRAEEVLRTPADVEWAVSEGRSWLLQARPITTSAPTAAAPPGARPTAWSNVNVGEVIPDVVTPMTWSVVGRMATALIDGLFGKLGIRVDPERITTLIAGRAYFNASLLVSAFEQLPFQNEQSVQSMFGGMDGPPGFRDLVPAPHDIAQVSKVRTVLGMPAVALWLVRHSPGQARRFADRWRADTLLQLDRLAHLRSEEDAAAVAAELVDKLLGLTDALVFAAVGMAAYTTLADITKRWLGDHTGSLTNRLLAGQGGVVSAESGLALARMAELARSDDRLSEALLSATDWAEARAAIDALARDVPLASSFLDAWGAFMAEHGHHARGELELSTPRWAEQPDDVLATIRTLLGGPPGADLAAAHERRATEASAAEEDATRRLGPLRRLWFRYWLAQARLGARTRENVKSEGVRVLAAARRALLALGAFMVRRDLLVAPADIFFLAWDEVAAVRRGELDAHPLVAARRARHEHDRAVTPPAVVLGEWDGTPAAAASKTLDVLTGLAVSSGVARGRARVLDSLDGDERVLPGEVLVAPFTDPGWTPFFVTAAAIVVDLGGLLSHGSIIAREYGIPAVVNVGSGTSSIATGDLVEVDGDSGIVRILERLRRA